MIIDRPLCCNSHGNFWRNLLIFDIFANKTIIQSDLLAGWWNTHGNFIVEKLKGIWISEFYQFEWLAGKMRGLLNVKPRLERQGTTVTSFSEDLWLSHLLPTGWKLNCNCCFLRIWSVEAVDYQAFRSRSKRCNLYIIATTAVIPRCNPHCIKYRLPWKLFFIHVSIQTLHHSIVIWHNECNHWLDKKFGRI